MQIIRICLWISLVFTGSCALAAQQAKVEYSIEILNPVQHIAKVKAVFPSTGQTEQTIMLPAWRTGKYKILNLAAGVGNVHAFDENGQALQIDKTDKSSWRVHLDKPQIFTFEYELYADQLGARTRHIDATHAFLDATSVLVYTELARAMPVVVTLKVPEGWESRSGLRKTDPHRFEAPNYDVLADSPIETGIHAFYMFEVDNKAHELVIWGDGNQNDQRIVKDLQKISAAAGRLWGAYPFERFVWMLHLTADVRGATEHINSTIIQTGRFKFSPRKDYLDFLATAAHEFIHTWNVKAYRPQGIHPYDYQKENYTPLLWLAEGSTSYFSPLLLLRAGVIDGKEFLSLWAKALERHLNRPGRERQSPAEASFDAWLDESAQWDHNAKADIYTQGMMVSWVLDVFIREQTGLKKGYEHIHRLLYERYPLAQQGGYSEAAVIELITEVTGRDATHVWKEYIHGTRQVDIASMLHRLGLEIQQGEKHDDNDGFKDPSLLWSGIHLVESGEDAKIQRVQRDSPAWQAGVTANDVIVAVNDYRVMRDSFPKRLKDYGANDRLKINFFRDDRLQSVNMVLGARSAEELKVLPLDKTNQQQRNFFGAWSGVDWHTVFKDKK